MATKENDDKFTIKKWEALCTWKLGGVHNRICGICRNGLDQPSQEYKVNKFFFLAIVVDRNRKLNQQQMNPSDATKNGLQLCFGACSHTFHLDCVQRWLKSRSICPMCNTEWNAVKYEKVMDVGDS